MTKERLKFSKIDPAAIEIGARDEKRTTSVRHALLSRMAELHNPQVEIGMGVQRLVGAVFHVELGWWRIECPEIALAWMDKDTGQVRARAHELVVYVHEDEITTFGVAIPHHDDTTRAPAAPQMSPEEIAALLGNDPIASAKLVATCTRCGENFTAIEVGRIAAQLADPAHQTLHHDGLCGGALGPYQAEDA